jgi:hypothetical protein
MSQQAPVQPAWTPQFEVQTILPRVQCQLAPDTLMHRRDEEYYSTCMGYERNHYPQT